MTKSGNVKIFAWDGSEFREILIDTTGHLQVDALSVANPPNLDKAISKLIDKSISTPAYPQTSSLAAGASETITYTPPAGKLWRFIFLYLSAPAPAGASSGTHDFVLRSPRGYRPVMMGRSTYATDLYFDYNYWRIADDVIHPSDQANLGIALSRLVYDNSHPVVMVYTNNTNVAQTGVRRYEMDSLVEYSA